VKKNSRPSKNYQFLGEGKKPILLHCVGRWDKGRSLRKNFAEEKALKKTATTANWENHLIRQWGEKTQRVWTTQGIPSSTQKQEKREGKKLLVDTKSCTMERRRMGKRGEGGSFI